MIQNIRHIALFILFVCSCLAVQAQGTLDKLKFEEAEQKYLNKDYSGAITLLEELEQKGLKNPRTLHLKIMAVSKHHAPGYDIVVQFKKDVDYYLKNYDIEGLEDKYKDVYEVSKTLSDKKYDEGILAEKNAQTYYNAKDYKNAMQWFLKADSYGNPSDKIGFYTGLMYEKGWGVEQNYTEAAKWYTKSAEQGNVNAQALLGYFFNVGQGVEKDYKKAIEWYTKAAEKGNADAQYNLGVCYLENNPKQAIYWFEKVIADPKQPDVRKAQARSYLIWGYRHGTNGFPKDLDKAIEWTKKDLEATGNDTFHSMSLAAMYQDKGNYEEAYKYYSKDESGGYFLAFYHYDGKVVVQNYAKAVEYWSVGEDKTSIFNVPLAVAYFTGKGVQKDVNRGVSIISETIKKMPGLTKMYMKNMGTRYREHFPHYAKDEATFFEYLKKEHNIIFEE